MELRAPGSIVLVSTYELGHAPHAVALLAGKLREEGFAPRSIDLSVENMPRGTLDDARLIVISTPMHTAMRLALDVLGDITRRAPHATIAFVGLYAYLHRELLRERGVRWVFAGELETPLTELICSLDQGDATGDVEVVSRKRQRLATPSREGIADLTRYARFIDKDGDEHLAGYAETTRGCLEMCRHCPVPAVYGGRFVAIDSATIIDDIATQVEAGARHITFGDPDFLNGPTHALRVAREFHRRWPDRTFDFTAQIANLLEHEDATRELATLGCAFVVTAVESLSDDVLDALGKRHRRGDVEKAFVLSKEIGLALRPTLVPFTPWTRLTDLADLAEWIAGENIEHHVAPVQMTVRLLVPPGSLLLESHPSAFGAASTDELGHPWSHSDRRVDDLCGRLASTLTEQGSASDYDIHRAFRGLIREACELPASTLEARVPKRVPRVSEPWFC